MKTRKKGRGQGGGGGIFLAPPTLLLFNYFIFMLALWFVWVIWHYVVNLRAVKCRPMAEAKTHLFYEVGLHSSQLIQVWTPISSFSWPLLSSAAQYCAWRWPCAAQQSVCNLWDAAGRIWITDRVPPGMSFILLWWSRMPSYITGLTVFSSEQACISIRMLQKISWMAIQNSNCMILVVNNLIFDSELSRAIPWTDDYVIGSIADRFDNQG